MRMIEKKRAKERDRGDLVCVICKFEGGVKSLKTFVSKIKKVWVRILQ